MLAFVTGQVVSKTEKELILAVGPLGLRLAVAGTTAQKVKIGETAKFLTYLHVREDLLELYGFLTEEELGLFKKLLSISGIGPKSALNILSLIEPAKLKAAVVTGKVDILTQISGIGRKTAERIIVELKNQFKNETGLDMQLADADLVATLTQLGYTREQAREAARHLPDESGNLSAQVKAALKYLNPRK